jgi:E-phenylitaconyl-CoA hydratase
MARKTGDVMSVDLSVSDGVATVLLNRPEVMNAIDYSMRRDIQDIWRRIDQDDTILAAIITGAGERSFCTGADLKNTPPPSESYAQRTFGARINESLTAGLHTDKPLICAFNGTAMGGGLEIGLACDIRIAADNARFALSEARVGTIPGSGGTQRLPRLVGHSDAMLMLLTGDDIDAAEALRIGLVSMVVPISQLQGAAQKIARRIADNAPLAVRAIKRLVRLGGDLPLEHAMEAERNVWGVLRDTQDRLEGRRAFSEKRKPDYRGC